MARYHFRGSTKHHTRADCEHANKGNVGDRILGDGDLPICENCAMLDGPDGGPPDGDLDE